MRLGTMTSPNRAEVHERHTHGSRNLYEFFGSGWHVTVSVVGVPRSSDCFAFWSLSTMGSYVASSAAYATSLTGL